MVDSNEHVGRGTSMIEYPNLTLKRLFSELVSIPVFSNNPLDRIVVASS